MQGFKGEKVSQYVEAGPKKGDNAIRLDGINYIASVNKNFLSNDPSMLHTGSNSGFQAINLAYFRGATTILLLGLDMQCSEGGNKGRKHWFGEHPDKSKPNFNNCINAFNYMAANLPDNLRIINCTRSTALNCFEKMNLELALSLVQDQA